MFNFNRVLFQIKCCQKTFIEQQQSLIISFLRSRTLESKVMPKP